MSGTIAILCSVGGWGGLEQNTVKTAAWLRDAGLDVQLLVASESRLTTAARERGLPVITFDQKHKHFAWSDAKKLWSLLQAHGISTLVIGHSRHLYTAVCAKRFSGNTLRLVFWQHVQITMSRRDPYHAWFYRQLDAFIAPLDYLRAQALERTSLQPHQLVQIPQVIDAAPYLATTHTKLAARQKLGLPLDAYIVGTIGRIDVAKGQEFLLRAAGLLRRSGSPIHVLLIGENSLEDYRSVLEHIVLAEGIADTVTIRDFTEDTRTVYAALDVFAMTSLSEPIGMVTLEAMATGLPVIGTNTGGTPELLDHGSAGVLVPPADPQALADAIVWCRDHPDEVAALIQHGRNVVRNRYDRPIQVDLFRQLLTRP